MNQRTVSLRSVLVGLAGPLVLAACATSPVASPPAPEIFFVGGAYAGEAGKEVMQGAMYVEHRRPTQLTQRYPLIFFHGAAQTAVNWMTTPDGRAGWAQTFVDRGYDVYLVDQPARGRSAWHPEIDGKIRNFSAPAIEMLFTASKTLGTWPQAKLHTQWPGDGPNKGRRGDPIFDQFYASQVEFVESNLDTQIRVKAAGAALLDRIGPAILVVHSQAGPFGWLLADVRPTLVKAVIAIEPNGPPIQASPVFGSAKQLDWGPTDAPITYNPVAAAAEELRVQQQAEPDGAGLVACWQQAEPARRLANLQGLPTLILVTEASYHAQYDHCLSNWLRQAGVLNDLVRLGDVGLHGNGHMVMIEKNSREVADWIDAWIKRRHL